MQTKVLVYSNTDYLDILKIQTDYLSKYTKPILLINENDINIDDIYSKYENIILYDNSKTYASRLLSCLNNLSDEYFILTHDIDIILDIDSKKIDELTDLMKRLNIDRIDLKWSNQIISDTYINIDKPLNLTTKENTIPINYDFLVKQNNPNNFIYNVNPSIWKKDTLIDILHKFKDKTYRNIEDIDVQEYSKKYDIYKIKTKTSLKCGYYDCVDFFKFLHLTHSGKIMPLNELFVTEHNQSYIDVKEDFIKIINTYNLKLSPKWRH